MNTPIEPVLTACPTQKTSDQMHIRLLGLRIESDEEESYQVHVRTSSKAPFVAGTVNHVEGNTWDLYKDGSTRANLIIWLPPDEVFALALGRRPDPTRIAAAVLTWPVWLKDRLVKRGSPAPAQ